MSVTVREYIPSPIIIIVSVSPVFHRYVYGDVPPEITGSTKVSEPQEIVQELSNIIDGAGNVEIKMSSVVWHPKLSVTVTVYKLVLSTNRKESIEAVFQRYV